MAEVEPMKELPADILFSNILPRLPAKSQSRFKCVCKQWHSFLRSPGFRKMHRQHVIDNDHQNNQTLLLLPNNRPWEFRTIDCESPEDGCTRRPLPFKVKPGQYISIVSSLHGMVCVGLSKSEDRSELSDLILWNPSTGEHKALSRAGYHNDCYHNYRNQFILYYSSSKDDYMLVYVTCDPSVYIYSLKFDTWRTVESTGWHYNFEPYYSLASVLFNEKLYFLYKDLAAPISYSLMEFDTQTEKLKDIATPDFGNKRTSFMGFMVVRDCIHLCVGVAKINSIGQDYTIEKWRMDGDGNWTMAETSSWKEHSCSKKYLMRNGNWLVYSWLEESFYVIDTKKQAIKNICYISVAFTPAGQYIENIVSPNQYLNFTDDLDQEDGVGDDKNTEDRIYHWKVPGFNQFVGIFKLLYSHFSNRSCRQITLFVYLFFSRMFYV